MMVYSYTIFCLQFWEVGYEYALYLYVFLKSLCNHAALVYSSTCMWISAESVIVYDI